MSIINGVLINISRNILHLRSAVAVSLSVEHIIPCLPQRGSANLKIICILPYHTANRCVDPCQKNQVFYRDSSAELVVQYRKINRDSYGRVLIIRLSRKNEGNVRCSINVGDAIWAAGAGGIAGAGSALLTKLGNPVDGGVSVACFCRDIAGAFGLHQTVEFSYLRPELAAIVLAAGVSAMTQRQFRPSGSSSPVVRFIIGIILSFGVFAFVGCPMRTGLRLAGGDPYALAGLAGLVAGIGIGTLFLVKGFTLGTTSTTTKTNGLAIHVIFILLLVLLLMQPVYITLSNQRHAPMIVSLVVGVLIGIAGQRSKLCFIGGFRNFFLIGDFTLLMGFIFLVLSAMVTNILLGQAHFGIHIIGSSDVIWSFFALCVVGIASTFLGGCPFRQLILASQGNGDSTITLLGILIGAAIVYNANFAFSAGSLDIHGKIAVSAGLLVLFLIGVMNREK